MSRNIKQPNFKSVHPKQQTPPAKVVIDPFQRGKAMNIQAPLPLKSQPNGEDIMKIIQALQDKGLFHFCLCIIQL